MSDEPPALLVRLAAMVELLAELADASRQLFMAFEAELSSQSPDETCEIAPPPPGATVRSKSDEGLMDWTEADIARLREFWAKGHSTSEIGRLMGISKNAVVGKAHRLKLPSRPSPIRARGSSPKPVRLPRVKASAPTPAPRPLETPRSTNMPLDVAITVTPLPPPPAARPARHGSDRLCAYPMGEPGTRGFRYCDAPVEDTKQPYCPEHRALCFLVKPAKSHTVRGVVTEGRW